MLLKPFPTWSGLKIHRMITQQVTIAILNECSIAIFNDSFAILIVLLIQAGYEYPYALPSSSFWAYSVFTRDYILSNIDSGVLLPLQVIGHCETWKEWERHPPEKARILIRTRRVKRAGLSVYHINSSHFPLVYRCQIHSFLERQVSSLIWEKAPSGFSLPYE